MVHGERAKQRICAMRLEKGAPFGVLLIAETAINEDVPVAGLDEQAAHCPGAKVVFIGRVEPLPEALGHDAEHGSAVEFEIAGGHGGNFHAIATFEER